MPLVRYERSSDFSWYVRHEDKYLIGAIDYTYPDYSCMRVEKLAARLSKHLPAIRAAIALGTPANAVSLMIREAIRR